MKNLPTFPDLEGASVFVSGGGSGIGAALTEGFLRQGSKVAFVQRSDASEFVARMEEETGNRPHFIACDITDTAALKAALAEVAEAHGPVTRLVSNAANDERHDVLEVDEAYWTRMIDINLKHYFFAAQAVVPGMKAAGGGSIVNFASISYMMGAGQMPIYVSANSGINGMTRAFARDLGPDRIRVNTVAPGWVMTEKQKEKWVTPEGLRAHIDKQCLKDEIQPEDIAGGVLYLSSDAARMVTGQSLVIDAGVVVTG